MLAPWEIDVPEGAWKKSYWERRWRDRLRETSLAAIFALGRSDELREAAQVLDAFLRNLDRIVPIYVSPDIGHPALAAGDAVRSLLELPAARAARVLLEGGEFGTERSDWRDALASELGGAVPAVLAVESVLDELLGPEPHSQADGGPVGPDRPRSPMRATIQQVPGKRSRKVRHFRSERCSSEHA
jgi:hypothetical protein